MSVTHFPAGPDREARPSFHAVPPGYELLRLPESDHPLVRRLSAGWLEVAIMHKATTMKLVWPTPERLTGARGPIIDALVGLFAEAAEAAGHLTRKAVHDAMREAFDPMTDHEVQDTMDYADALLLHLERARGPRTGEVIDIETLRLIKASQ